MNTNTDNANNTEVNAAYETSKFALGVGITMAALVGIWGVASLVSALSSDGPLNLVKSYFTAVTGL